jgi:hypothetical protein
MTKEEAIFKVLRVLKSPMMIMSPAKKEALTLAEEHCITVADLISEYEKIAMSV